MTPGPWRYDERIGWLVDSNETPVPMHHCFMEDAYEGHPEAEANARFIANAPDLYAALRTMYDCTDLMTAPGQLTIAREQARVALAKAEPA